MPLAAYNVSGEYSIVKAAAMQGWVDEKKLVMENMIAIKRAGAQMIITYHALDVARWLMGREITEIYAQGAVLKHEFLKELNDVDDGQMLLKFQDGGLGMIEISRNANDVYDTRTEVIGLEKSVFVGQNQLTPYTLIGNQEITVDMANWCLGRFKDAYELEMQAFVDCVLDGKPSMVTAYDGMMGIKLALAATESYKTNKPVKITY